MVKDVPKYITVALVRVEVPRDRRVDFRDAAYVLDVGCVVQLVLDRGM